jgi:S-adenosylmethionine-dependent methyltransferase
VSDVFSPVAEAWAEQLGKIREVVRQTLVAEQLEDAVTSRAGESAARVLDVGCGQGTQALRLARQGHQVVGLDSNSELLARFRAALEVEPETVRRRVDLVEGPGEQARDLTAGSFDLVLCHSVLMYLHDDDAMLDSLASVTADGGAVSLLVRNGAALAMRPGLLGEWAAVPAAMDEQTYTNRLGVRARAHLIEDLDDAMRRRGFARTAWWGVRVFSDHVDGAPPQGSRLDELLAAERAVSGRDPYRQTAALTHVIYRAQADTAEPPC